MKKFVQIQSIKNIEVTAGLQCIDATDTRKALPNNLNVKPAWSKLRVLIREGIGYYPARIQNWNTVKCLVKDKIITIGSETDEIINKDEEKKVLDQCRKLELAEQKYQKDIEVNDELLGRKSKKTKKAVEEQSTED